MNRATIQAEARRRMSIIEDRYAEYYPIPHEIQGYYRLCHLITLGSLEAYYHQYGGWLPIQIGDSNDGKHDLGFGALSAFERDCAEHLNADIDRREMDAGKSVRVLAIGTGRPA